jgi:hypothetical protein
VTLDDLLVRLATVEPAPAPLLSLFVEDSTLLADVEGVGALLRYAA